MNIGILGSGAMGRAHAKAFAKLDGVRVSAISSRNIENARRLADEVGALATTDDMAVITDPNVNAIAITLPTHLHKLYTLAALRAGKPVLLEKPFALTPDDCDAMLAAQRETGTPLMIAHVLRFWPEYVALANFVKGGALGVPLSVVAARLGAPPAASWFRNADESGGAVLDLMIHDLDALNWLLGQPKTVYARGHLAAPGLWNDVHCILDYGGKQGSIEASQFYPAGFPFTMALKVLCERGSVELSFRAGSYLSTSAQVSLMAYEAGKAYVLDVEPADAYERQIAYFISCLRAGRQFAHGTPEQARLAVACSSAARQSLESGEVVKIA
jgi:predicted dehydrogenase